MSSSNNNWYQQPSHRVVEEFDSSPSGISSEEATKRLRTYGENTLPEAKPTPLWRIFLYQFESPLIYVLIAAAVAIYLLHGPSDAVVIGFVLLFNAVIGAIQEGRAQNTLHALKHFLESKATVFRDETKQIMPDRFLVPGDVIWLQEGEKVPADARILQNHDLLVTEAALTGESTPIHKIGNEIEHHVTLADQKNMVFKGSLVLGGSATAIVVATGIKTHIGSISALLTENEGDIPLKREIARLSHYIIGAVAVVCALLMVIGLSKGYPLSDMISTAVSLAVSVIPEGLPVVLTLILSTGVWRMSKRHALVKRLQAVEGLGQIDVIATDKTGTITQNQMTMTKLYLKGKLYDITGAGYDAEGSVKLNGTVVHSTDHSDLIRAATIAAYCASAQLSYKEDTKKWQVSGDPTEAAMLVFAQKAGVNRDDLHKDHPVIEEQPFDYKNKLHAVLGSWNGRHLLAVTGAPEAVLKHCKLDEEDHALAEEAINELTSQGLRVVGFAFKEGDLHHIEPHLSHLRFGGFFCLQDPLHDEVPETVLRVRKAGIRVVLITGDHKATARSIAHSAHIYEEGDVVISGAELELMTEAELQAKLPDTSVFCRVTPEQKMQIIHAYQGLGLRIAMTGDGVNDAPSLVAADLGIAMGQVGTEVAKEAGDIILLDDNFNSIVAAIEEGRGIYATIRKSITYLFTTGVAEVVAISASIIFGLPLLLQASQIIWLNFVTDGFLTAALGVEPHEGNLLEKKRSKHGIVDARMLGQILWVGSLMAVGSLILFALFLDEGQRKASTLALTSLAAVQWVYAWNVRTTHSIFSGKNRSKSPYLFYATILVVGLQVLAVHVPLFQRLLHTTSLSLSEWGLALIPAILIFFIEEFRKYAMPKGDS